MVVQSGIYSWKKETAKRKDKNRKTIGTSTTKKAKTKIKSMMPTYCAKDK
jgi:hypothetical protein